MDPLAIWGRLDERQDEAAARPPYGGPPMDPFAIWGRGREEDEAAYRAMVARRQRFDAALAAKEALPAAPGAAVAGGIQRLIPIDERTCPCSPRRSALTPTGCTCA